MHPALRFLLASLASALAALLTIDLIWPFAELLNPGTDTSLVEVWGSTIVLLPLVLLVGGIIALPLAMAAGGAMLAFEHGRGAPLPLAGWLAAGLAAGLMVAVLFWGESTAAERAFVALWFGASGLLGAWAFRRVWHGRRRADSL